MFLLWSFLPVAAQEKAPSSTPLSQSEISQLQAKAQAGDPAAQLSLGRAYDKGAGLPQNDEQAMRWYRAAAEQGDAVAQNSVGVMYRSGRGAPEDKVEALRWYSKAAKQGNANAMFNVGTAYYNGDGAPVDDTIADAWFLLAQSFGCPPADDAVQRMNQEGPERGRRIQSDAFEKIGDMYKTGKELPLNLEQAVQWYRKAAESGRPRAQIKLADVLVRDQSKTPDYGEIRGLCEKAMKVHYAPAADCLGSLYQEGLGVERDLPKAAKFFDEGTNLGSPRSALRLGQMYWDGAGLRQDKVLAYEFVYLAATSDLPQALQEKERLEKELTSKEVSSGKAKAEGWLRQHPMLVLKKRSPLAD